MTLKADYSNTTSGKACEAFLDETHDAFLRPYVYVTSDGSVSVRAHERGRPLHLMPAVRAMLPLGIDPHEIVSLACNTGSGFCKTLQRAVDDWQFTDEISRDLLEDRLSEDLQETIEYLEINRKHLYVYAADFFDDCDAASELENSGLSVEDFIKTIETQLMETGFGGYEHASIDKADFVDFLKTEMAGAADQKDPCDRNVGSVGGYGG